MQLVTPVASLFQLKQEDDRFYADNDDNYRRYERVLRSYCRMAWFYHRCDYCRESINPGDFYQAWVHVSHPPKKVPGKRRKRRLWVEKKHDPECPDELRRMEEEMYQQWEREDQARRDAERKSA